MVSILTALIIQENDVVCDAGGPDANGMWMGWITFGAEKNFRPLLNTEAIYETKEDAVIAVTKIVAEIKKTNLTKPEEKFVPVSKLRKLLEEWKKTSEEARDNGDIEESCGMGTFIRELEFILPVEEISCAWCDKQGSEECRTKCNNTLNHHLFVRKPDSGEPRCCSTCNHPAKKSWCSQANETNCPWWEK
jgi:hypothetical protein